MVLINITVTYSSSVTNIHGYNSPFTFDAVKIATPPQTQSNVNMGFDKLLFGF